MSQKSEEILDKLRGHDIVFIGDEWLYNDTKTPTVGNERDCGHCGKGNTPEGHDGCLGVLPDTMNACCGHGVSIDAYIQRLDGSCIRGIEALKEMNSQTFKQRVNKNLKCPKCKSHIIFIHGGGWDYDVEYCSSSRVCDYEVVYDTTTDISEDELK